MTMRDVISSSVGMFRFFIVAAVVLAIASSLGAMPYFQGSFAFAQAEKTLAMVDYIGLFLTVGFFVVSVGLAALSVNNRVFMPISLIFLVVSVLLSAIFADVYLVLVSSGPLAQAAQALPIINLLASNMPLVIGVMGLSVILALYTRMGGGRRAAR